MLSKPIKANNIEIELFSSKQYGDDVEKLEFEVNAWLKNQPQNIVVHDIAYHHCGRTPKGDIVSVAIISSPEG